MWMKVTLLATIVLPARLPDRIANPPRHPISAQTADPP